jgi:hypothetical protein
MGCPPKARSLRLGANDGWSGKSPHTSSEFFPVAHLTWVFPFIKRASLASRSDANLSQVLARSDHIFLALGVVAVCAIRTQFQRVLTAITRIDKHQRGLALCLS